MKLHKIMQQNRPARGGGILVASVLSLQSGEAEKVNLQRKRVQPSHSRCCN